ncbi:MAG: FmdB family zinc ribbon protein [bacterium]
MPTYEYECLDCGHHFDVFQSMLEDPYKTCPVCRGKVKRLISSGAGLIFKGSGFYITDYKKKETSVTGPVKKDKPAETPKGKESSPESKDSKKSED